MKCASYFLDDIDRAVVVNGNMCVEVFNAEFFGFGDGPANSASQRDYEREPKSAKTELANNRLRARQRTRVDLRHETGSLWLMRKRQGY